MITDKRPEGYNVCDMLLANPGCRESGPFVAAIHSTAVQLATSLKRSSPLMGMFVDFRA